MVLYLEAHASFRVNLLAVNSGRLLITLFPGEKKVININNVFNLKFKPQTRFKPFCHISSLPLYIFNTVINLKRCRELTLVS